VDAQSLLSYREARDGRFSKRHQRSRSMSSFIAAATSYANHGIPMLRFSSTIRCSVSSASAT
jgi:pyruvate dehydrogenase E1 component